MITYALDLIPFTRRGSSLPIASRISSGSPRLLYCSSSGRVHYIRELPFPAEEFFGDFKILLSPKQVSFAAMNQGAWRLNQPGTRLPVLHKYRRSK